MSPFRKDADFCVRFESDRAADDRPARRFGRFPAEFADQSDSLLFAKLSIAFERQTTAIKFSSPVFKPQFIDFVVPLRSYLKNRASS